MPELFSSEIVCVITALEYDNAPTTSTLRCALFGGLYDDPDNPTSPKVHYRGCIKSDVVFKKKIGIALWKESSQIDFGFLDLAVEDQDEDVIDFAREVTAATVTFYRVNLNNPAADELEILASARTTDIAFPDEHTVRMRLESILKSGFVAPINELYYNEYVPHLAGKPYPIAWGKICDPYQVLPTVEVDPTILHYDVTDIEIASFESYVYDSGIALQDDGSYDQFDPYGEYGFVLNQNPFGRITSGRILCLDPLDPSHYMHGLFRFFRLAMTRAGIWQYANQTELTQLESDIGFGDLFPQYFTMNVTSLERFMDEILGGVTGWYYVDELSEIHFGRMIDPDGETAVFSFTDSEMVGKIKVEDDKAPGLTDRMEWAYNPGAYTDEELAAGVEARDRVEFKTDIRVVVAGGYLRKRLWTADTEDVTADNVVASADGFRDWKWVDPVVNIYYDEVQTRWPMPIHLPYGCPEDGSPSAFDLAQGEIDRWWGELYYKRRRFYTFTVELNGEQFNSALPQLGDFCEIQSDRFRLISTPKTLLVRRLDFNFSKNQLTIEGWG